MSVQNTMDFCRDAGSQLTYSGSAGSKKRAYMALSQHNNVQVQRQLATSSTSGRRIANTVPAMAGDIMSCLLNQSKEIDTLVRYQMERGQSGMELLRRKHTSDLVSMVQDQATKRLRVKDKELENVTLRNMELEEQVRQLSSESLVWFNYAKTTEAVVSSLRANLDKALDNQNGCGDVEEGYGESRDESSPADDVESSCEGDEDGRNCRVCREREVCVLLLPCRHLCLCRGCEAKIVTCPVCKSTRNASIQVVV